MKTLNIEPDFDFTKPENTTRLLFVHRKLADADIYFVDNRSDRTETLDASFRVTGKAPALWHAETGKIEPATYKIAEGKTTVPLTLEPWGSVFVVFQKSSRSTSRTLPKLQETQLASVEGSWDVSFQPGRGAPASIKLDKLISWNDSPDAGVKYFSGTATYTKSLDASPDWFKHSAKVFLDLGDVKNLAEVTVNGKSLGIVWHAPYRVDVSGALKKGSNEITLKVTNAWVNRLIGDQQPNAVKYTYADVKPYNANSPLLPSGLIGPVRVVSLSKQ
jgi:hypothetical protein